MVALRSLLIAGRQKIFLLHERAVKRRKQKQELLMHQFPRLKKRYLQFTAYKSLEMLKSLLLY